MYALCVMLNGDISRVECMKWGRSDQVQLHSWDMLFNRSSNIYVYIQTGKMLLYLFCHSDESTPKIKSNKSKNTHNDSRQQETFLLKLILFYVLRAYTHNHKNRKKSSTNRNVHKVDRFEFIFSLFSVSIYLCDFIYGY